MKCQRYKCQNKATAYFKSKQYCAEHFNMEKQESKENQNKPKPIGKWWEYLLKIQNKSK